MISIITPTFNRAHILTRAYNSLREQKREFEWIVVDDASTDDTVSLVERWASSDSRIRLVKLKKNVGVNGARMAGVRSSTAPFVFFLDSDDELAAGALEVLEEVSHSLRGSVGVGVLPTSSYNDEDGLASLGLNEGQILGEYEIVCERVLEKELSYLYRRDVFDFQGLPEDMRGCEFLFVYGLSRRYLFVVHNKVVRNINRQSDNLSSSKGMIVRFGEMGLAYLRLIKQHREKLEECRETKDLYLRKSAFRMRLAGLSMAEIIKISQNSGIKTRVFLIAISFFDESTLIKFETLRLRTQNLRLFGRD